MGTGDVELFPSDEKLTVDAIAELQEENERLKRLSKGWLEEKKTLNDKLNKIEQIVAKYDGTIPSMMCRFYDIQKVLEKE